MFGVIGFHVDLHVQSHNWRIQDKVAWGFIICHLKALLEVIVEEEEKVFVVSL